MTVKELLNELTSNVSWRPACADCKIRVYVPDGSVGGIPGVGIQKVGFGIDGDSGSCILYPEKPLRNKPKRIIKKKQE